MQISEPFCQIQGHESNFLSHICVYTKSLHNSRWLCQECMRNHEHEDGIYGSYYLRTEIEFMNDFNSKMKPSIESVLKSEEGIQIKSNYIKKIKNDFINHKIFKKLQNNEMIYAQNSIIMDDIDNLIDFYDENIIRIQNLKNAYQKLIDIGVRSLYLEEINILLIRQTQMQGENQMFQELIEQLEINYNEFNISQHKKMIKKLYHRLIKLKEYIKFHEYRSMYILWADYIYLIKNEKYLATLDLDYALKITDLNSNNMIKQIQLKKRISSFDYQQRHMIIFSDQGKLYHYYLSNLRHINLIRNYKFNRELLQYIQCIQIINNNKFMIQGYKYIEIRDLIRNRFVNKIILNDSLIKQYSYGRVKSIIVIILHYDQNILIFKDDQSQPFIQQNINIEQQDIKIKQVALTKDDQRLFSQDKQFIKLWQIDYKDKKLILINRICVNKEYSYWFSQGSYIIRELDEKIQILDENFNILEEIQKKVKRYDKIWFSEQFILLMYDTDPDEYSDDSQSQSTQKKSYYINHIKILRSAKNDYQEIL